jgi:hypothetical protein
MFDTAARGFAPPPRPTFAQRLRERPRPSFAVALSAGGGVIVAIGVLLLAVDVFTRTDDGWVGALFFVVLAAIASVGLLVLPPAAHPGCVSALAASVPAVYGFLIFPSTDSFGDIRLFFALTIATWLLFFAVSTSRGRPILLALAAALLYVWMVAEVADVDRIATPIDSGVTVSSSLGTSESSGTTFGGQNVTLDQLDPTDPLYPLAQSCDGGDFDACSELAARAEPGSNFEAFGLSCGGTGFGCDASIDTLDSTSAFTSPLSSQRDKALQIGLVSLAFGAVYLGALWFLDRRHLRVLGTAFVPTAVVALAVAAIALGEKTDSATAGGAIAIALGVVIGVVGWFGSDRRFTTWTGGVLASVGAIVIAADVAPEPSPSGDNADLIGPGLVVLAFGLAVVGLALLAHRLLEAGGESATAGTPPPPAGGPHSAAPPTPPIPPGPLAPPTPSAPPTQPPGPTPPSPQTYRGPPPAPPPD